MLLSQLLSSLSLLSNLLILFDLQCLVKECNCVPEGEQPCQGCSGEVSAGGHYGDGAAD